ncbi:hypothetical protein [Spirosoma fluminis]
MMLSTLDQITQTLGLVFLYGEPQAFDVEADRETDPGLNTPGREQFILYHEGYVGGPLREDAQGAFEPNYALKLYVLLPSQQTDQPVHRRPGFEQLEPLLYHVLDKLRKDYVLSGMIMKEGINLTNRNLDGIQVALTATPKILSVLC